MGKKKKQLKNAGDVNKQYYPHIFKTIKILDKIFSKKVFTDGDKNTIKVACASYSEDLKDPFNSIHSAEIKYLMI